MKLLNFSIAILLALSFLVPSSFALDGQNEQRLAFEHLLYISNIDTYPSEVSPGSEAQLSFYIENTGSQFIRDIRIAVSLPDEIAPYKDVTTRKITQMNSGQMEGVTFNIIPLPDVKEGIYKIGLTITYINYVGDERQENETISIMVGSSPSLIAELGSSDIYQGNYLGTIKVKVINDNVGDIKFLKVNLEDSDSYSIIGGAMDYVGDLDSDDFSEVNFKVSLDADLKTVDFPVTLAYKDSLNRDYEQKVTLTYVIPTAGQAGVKASRSWIVFVVIIALGVIYLLYRRRSKNLMKHKKGLSFNTKF